MQAHTAHLKVLLLGTVQAMPGAGEGSWWAWVSQAVLVVVIVEHYHPTMCAQLRLGCPQARAFLDCTLHAGVTWCQMCSW
jgi:hypothetical protein